MGKVIAMANQKGGVGKTTSSINLAACLAVAEKKTLLIDLDPQGNASVGLGLEKENFSNNNIYHALIGIRDINECIYETELPFLNVCPADNNLVGAEIELVSQIARETKLKIAIEKISQNYDYVIIDCPPSLGMLSINAFCASDSYIVPLQTEYFAMEGLAQLLNTLTTVKASLNNKLEMEGILLTMYSKVSNLHNQVVEDITQHFKEKVFETIIPRDIKLSESPGFGKPIILYKIDSKGSEAYLSLAREVISHTSDRSHEVTTSESSYH